MLDLEAVVNQWFALAHTRDFPSLRGMYTTDATYVRANSTSNGHDEIVEYLAGLKTSFPDHDACIDAIVVAPDAATVEWTETGSHTTPYDTGAAGVIAPTGKSFDAKIVDIFRFEGDRIKSQHEYFDRLGLLSQLGWIEIRYIKGS